MNAQGQSPDSHSGPTSQRIEQKMARVFYLHTSTKLDSGTVFYKTVGKERASVLLQLFRKEYGAESDGDSFSMTPGSEVPRDEQILLEEAFGWLEVYDDPDPGIYDPPPTKGMMQHAQYAQRASRWESYVSDDDTDGTCGDSNESTNTQPSVSFEEMPKSQKVFISYSHDSETYLKQVLALSDSLRADGVDCHIDQYEESPPQGWPRWCDKQVRDADFVLVACTETYLRRFRGEEESGKGLGGTWEGHIVTQELYNAQASNTKFLPIVFTSENRTFIPTPLQGATHYKLLEQYGDLYRRLTNQPLIAKPPLGAIKPMLPRHMPALPALKPRESFIAPPVETFSHEETISAGGEELYNELIAANFISHSFGASRSIRELIEELAAHSDKPIPIDSVSSAFGEQRTIRGRVFFGNPGDHLEEILSAYPKVRWWMSKRGLNIEGGSSDGEVSELVAGTRDKNRPADNEKAAALKGLYRRIEKIADDMGGGATRLTASRSIPSAMTAAPRAEDIPTLRVEMPDSFEVEFSPSFPLSIGNVLTVQAKRNHSGYRKTDWQVNFGPEGWRRTQALLSDDEIRACLTPEGPRPVF